MNNEPEVYSMRRRRNVTLPGIEEKQDSERTNNHGINWDDPETVNKVEFDSIESCDNAPQLNQEHGLEEKDQEKTIPFRVGNFVVSLGQLGAPKNSEQTQKLTVYLDTDLVDVMKNLKKARLIPSYSWLVAEAVKQYLIVNGS